MLPKLTWEVETLFTGGARKGEGQTSTSPPTVLPEGQISCPCNTCFVDVPQCGLENQRVRNEFKTSPQIGCYHSNNSFCLSFWQFDVSKEHSNSFTSHGCIKWALIIMHLTSIMNLPGSSLVWKPALLTIKQPNYFPTRLRFINNLIQRNITSAFDTAS